LQGITDEGATSTNTITLSPSGNNGALVANGSGSGIGIDITHSGSGVKLNIGATGSGDAIRFDTDKFVVDDSGNISSSLFTASRILSTDVSKVITALDTATYPDLTELSYVKGVTSAIQTQLNTKITASSTDTLTNKTIISTTNVVEEITTTASDTTPNPTGGSLRNFYTITALAGAAAFQVPSGTPADGNYLTIRVKDDGTARALTWDAIYRAGTDVALPSTTTLGKEIYIGFRYNFGATKWDLLAVANGF
jgi:hypothetical protein